MTKRLLPLLIGLMALTGCAHHYVVRLNNGMRVTTNSKPRLEQGNYYFKDAKGRVTSVSAGRVVEIVSSSMATEEKDRFKPTPVHP